VNSGPCFRAVSTGVGGLRPDAPRADPPSPDHVAVGSVADPKAYVTDTHPLLLHASGGRGLSRRAAACFGACERRGAIVYVPAAALWETSLLARVGRVDLGRSLRAFAEALFSNPAYQPLDLTTEQVSLADESRPNDDPFDALICAAALDLGLPLITRDGLIQDWGGVRTVW
jgi:PIN domain nuclease of toxin-antitoxin system